MQLAELSKKKFEGVKQRDAVIGDTTVSATKATNIIEKFVGDSKNHPQYRPLNIPRRPDWEKSMTREQIQGNENTAFLNWRRDLAQVEENNVNLAITPFEKNVEVWKQLWRVIEKSDVLLQIVDARNPYFYFSEDLEKYITEVSSDKKFILCINKADFLSEQLIKHWSDYFLEKGVNHVFISALKEQDKLD